jgi:prophage regulatory protein
VLDRIGVSRSSIYLWMRQGRFPKPISLGPRAIGWVEADIDAWIADRAGEGMNAPGTFGDPSWGNPGEKRFVKLRERLRKR